MISCWQCDRIFTRYIAEDTDEQVAASASKFGWSQIKDRWYCATCREELVS